MIVVTAGCAEHEKFQPRETLTEVAESEPAEACGVDAVGRLDRAPESAFIGQGTEIEGQRSGCTSVVHATAGAAQSVLRLSLNEWTGSSDALVSFEDLKGDALTVPVAMGAGDSLEVQLAIAGEALIVIEPTDPDEPANGYGLGVSCVEGCGVRFTRYPVVLQHGFGGSGDFGEDAYFFQVQETLSEEGYLILTPTVEPIEGTEIRGLQFASELEGWRSEGLARRFNVIGHSQGAIDARYVVSTLGRHGWVASIVSVGTPHQGTPVADVILGAIEGGPVPEPLVDLAVDAVTSLYGIEGEDHSLAAALNALATETMVEFNAQNPNHPGVYYGSWAGISCGVLDLNCQAACGGEVVDPLLAITHFILYLYGIESDGMVPLESAKWGDHQGELCADHLDQVGLFEDTPTDAFDHIAFYRSEFQRLAERGL
jgi:triacylglycerol lipase